MGVVNLRLSGLCHDVHSGVFDHFRTVPADLLPWLQVQEPAVGFVEMGDISVGIDDQDSGIDIVKYPFVQRQFCLRFSIVFILIRLERL